MTINRNIEFMHLLLKLWNGFVVQHIGNLILIWNMFRKYINISYNKMTYDFHRYIALYNPYCCIYIYLGYVAVNFSAFIVYQIFCFITQDKWPIFSTGKLNLFTSMWNSTVITVFHTIYTLLLTIFSDAYETYNSFKWYIKAEIIIHITYKGIITLIFIIFSITFSNITSRFCSTFLQLYALILSFKSMFFFNNYIYIYIYKDKIGLTICIYCLNVN